MARIVALSIVLAFLFSCKPDIKEKQPSSQQQSEQETISEEEKPALKIEIIRIEQEMFSAKTRKGIKKILNKYPDFSDKFLKRAQFPHDSILVNSFYQLSNNKSLDSIYKITQEVFGDFYQTGLQFQEAFKNIKASYPKFKTPVIYTVITGMGNDMFVNDSMVVVGLEFFLAEKSRYKPDFPRYLQVRYRKEYVVPMSLAMISNKFNQTDYLDNSLVAEMIYYGKSYYFLEKTLPGIQDTLITGYSKEILADVEKNQDLIWAHFIEKKLLFETKHEVVNKYVGERPTTYEIGNKCPGRIGRWVGWQIVKRYMENNPDITLVDLMMEKDAKKIFNISKYKPRKGRT